MKKLWLVLALTTFLAACQPEGNDQAPREDSQSSQLEDQVGQEQERKQDQAEESILQEAEGQIEEDQAYYEVEDVAAYLNEYEMLPPNYITKSEARDMDWSVEDNEGYIIGGDYFGNREGLLPEAPGRQYYEADIEAGYTNHRGPERLVYSDDGLIYYTDDHYQSFERLY